MRHAKSIVEVRRSRIFAADVIDFLVIVRVSGNVDFVGRDSDHWTVYLMQSFNLEVVPTVEVRLVELGDSCEEWTRNLCQRVVVAAIDAR